MPVVGGRSSLAIDYSLPWAIGRVRAPPSLSLMPGHRWRVGRSPCHRLYPAMGDRPCLPTPEAPLPPLLPGGLGRPIPPSHLDWSLPWAIGPAMLLSGIFSPRPLCPGGLEWAVPPRRGCQSPGRPVHSLPPAHAGARGGSWSVVEMQDLVCGD